jgi:hypothetical protein
MKFFRKNMMNILFTDLVENFASYLKIGATAAVLKAMVTLKKHFIGKAVLINVTLDYFQQVLIPPCKTRTSKTNDDFTPMIHCLRIIVV